MDVGEIHIPNSEFTFEFVRSPGAGGQNVNKVNSKAVLRWDLVNSPSLPEDVKKRFLARWPRRVSSSGKVVLTSSRPALDSRVFCYAIDDTDKPKYGWGCKKHGDGWRFEAKEGSSSAKPMLNCLV